MRKRLEIKLEIREDVSVTRTSQEDCPGEAAIRFTTAVKYGMPELIEGLNQLAIRCN